MYTGNNLDNYDKGKVILMLQHCKKWGVTVHLCHGVLGHFHICWCNITLKGVLVHDGVFHNTLKRFSKVL